MYLLAIRLMMMMLAEQQNLCVVIKIPDGHTNKRENDDLVL